MSDMATRLRNIHGLLIVLCGPSGVGKSTISRMLAEQLNVWYTSAPPRGRRSREDDDGQDLRAHRPATSSSAGSTTTSSSNTPRSTATTTARRSTRRWTTWPPGKDVLLEIDVQGALQVRYQYPDALLIFILPPDEPTLLQRLTDRGRDSAEDIDKRFRAAKREIHMAKGSRAFDYMVVQRRPGPRGRRRSPKIIKDERAGGIRLPKTNTKDQGHMIEALKSDEIVNKVGGRFKLTALIQKRMLELMDGARPLVERGNMTDLEVVIQEILQDKIAIDYEAAAWIGRSNVLPSTCSVREGRTSGHVTDPDIGCDGRVAGGALMAVAPAADTTPPMVVSVSYVDEPRQEITVRFSEWLDRSIDASDMHLKNLDTGQAHFPLYNVFTSVNPPTPTSATWQVVGRLPAGRYQGTIPAGSVSDTSGNVLADDYTFEFSTKATVSVRRPFYNNGAFDGNKPAADNDDVRALPDRKYCLLPGEQASVDNVSNYSKGINGLLLTMAGLPAGRTPGVADMSFAVATGRTPTGWATAPAAVGPPDRAPTKRLRRHRPDSPGLARRGNPQLLAAHDGQGE